MHALDELRNDKSVVLMRLLTGLVSTIVLLVGWLCVQSMEHTKTLVRMEERSLAAIEQYKIFHEEQIKQDLTINRLSLEMKDLQLMAASHNWRKPLQD